MASRSRLPAIVGILNVTPDSFSDGGEYATPDAALRHAELMVSQGASVIDVGGESTRPGAEPVPYDRQCERVVPVIERLRDTLPSDILISIDARDARVAAAGLAAGAGMLNDVSGGADPAMLQLAAAHRVPIVLMHMQGTPENMQLAPQYADVVAEVAEYLQRCAARAIAAGIAESDVILDPGIGFGKTKIHNLALLANLERIVGLGHPVMLGTSRKRFMGAICRETVFRDLVGATCATTALGASVGVAYFRVHDVRENRQAMEVVLAMRDLRSAAH